MLSTTGQIETSISDSTSPQKQENVISVSQDDQIVNRDDALTMQNGDRIMMIMEDD